MKAQTLPIKLESTANRREHWGARARRAKEHRKAALLIAVHSVRLPVVVTIVRVGRRLLDSDNLAISAKALRDGIADRLGVDDNDPRIEWQYAQEIGKDYAARVIFSAPKEKAA